MRKTYYLHVTRKNAKETYGKVFNCLGYDPVLLIPIQFDDKSNIVNLPDVVTIVASIGDEFVVSDKLYTCQANVDKLNVTAVINDNVYALNRGTNIPAFKTINTIAKLSKAAVSLPAVKLSNRVQALIDLHKDTMLKTDISDNIIERFYIALKYNMQLT